MYKKFGKNDVFFIGFLFLFCVALSVSIYKGGAVKGSYVTVTIDGQEFGPFALDEEQVFNALDAEKKIMNTVTIKDGKAYMSFADCPDQLCTHQNAIMYDKQSIICLPNKVVVTVTSDKKDDVDINIP
jgi:hypothetical protein